MSQLSRYQTGRGPCPVNGAKRWSYLGNLQYPTFIISHSSPTHDPIPGWVYRGESETGGQMYAPKKEGDFLKSPFLSPVAASPSEVVPTADPALKNRVYRTLLQLCPLSPSHRSHLVRRKLPVKKLRSLLPFGSLPHPRLRPKLAQQIREELSLPVEELLSVPGFFVNTKGHLSIGGVEGLLFPSFDTKGRIQALQIRKDQIKKDQSRYTWLSSASKGGTGSGAPACFLGDRHSSTLWITEGSIKGAALLLHEWAEATISVAGVGNTKSAIEILETLDNVEEVVIAFDADWNAKIGVLKGLARLVEAIQKRGLKVQAVGWNPEYGKGIDDAIVGGLEREQLFALPIDGLLRAVEKVQLRTPRLKTKDHLPIWEPPTALPPTQEELRKQTAQVVFDALREPAGTFTSVAANTGSGKTYATIRKSPEQTLLIYRNYAPLEEAEAEMRQVHGQGMVRVLYGRIAPSSDPNDHNANKRYKRAGCPQYAEMKKRSERGHSPCQGCPFAPKPKTSKEEEQELCPYWEQRLETVNHPTPYLLAVPQSFANNPSLLQLLPSEETRGLFGEYNQLVIDDCPDFISHLIREQSISQSDVEQWSTHPSFDLSDPDHSILMDWIKLLLLFFAQKALTPEQAKKLQKLSSQVVSLKEPVCEQPWDDGQWPLRAVHPLATWLCQNGETRLEGEEEQRKLIYLRPSMDLLKRLKQMTICHLDATPDESLLSWFSNLTGMRFKAPEMKRVFPKIIQVPDILWDRSQLQSRQPLVRALTEHIHDEQGIVLGFKNREGEEEHHLALDGHWGYSERGLNCYTGVESIALLGHYALPLSEVKGIAWRMRALSNYMDIPEPDTFLGKDFSETRRYSDPWRPWTRTMHTADDTLVEHLRRHRHTSAVVQGANRPRNLQAPVYLLSGEPLDGLPWSVPVELKTCEELATLLELKIEDTASKPRTLNASLQTINDEKMIQAQERIEGLMPGARKYMDELGQVPGIRMLRRFLGTEGKLAKQSLAYQVRDTLLQEIGDRDVNEQRLYQGDEGPSEAFERGVPHCHYKDIKEIKAVWGTPHSKTILAAENLATEEEESPPCQSGPPLPSSGPSLPSSGPSLPPEEPQMPPVEPLSSEERAVGSLSSEEPYVEPLTSEERASIPPMAQIRLGICDIGENNGWNDEVIRQVSKTYDVDPILLYRLIGISPDVVSLLH